MILKKKLEIKEKAETFVHALGEKRCKICTLPRPCRHHERELYRAGLSEDALEKELQRDERAQLSPRGYRAKQPEFDMKQDSLMMESQTRPTK